ncbi:glutathione synthase [Candidatus Aerophobetes bacterium]|nr:glutathione synthase [Candidatus Aerophobetes bacterium]
MSLNIAFIMDPFEKLDSIDEDTSCCLIMECLGRGHKVYYLQIKDLELQANEARGKVRQISERKKDKFIMNDPEMLSLDTFHAIFIRKDPPFDLDYLYATYILEYASPALVINSPRGIRDANEKLYILNFPEFAPRCFVSKDPRQLKKFLREVDGQMVVKPLNSCSGKGILYLRGEDINLNSLLETATEEGERFVIAQEFLPQVKEGDKRILLLEGKPLGAMCRVPPANDYRANIHRGAKYVQTKITAQDEKLCQHLSSRLIKEGIYFAGLDIIGEKIVEINVTSPAGIPEINHLQKTCLEKVVIDWVEKKVTLCSTFS